jgi:HTH-type transcriptional regulator / antitoxin HigA
MATKAHGRRVQKDDYLELVIAFPLKAIRDDAHLAQAIEVIDRLTIIPEDKLRPGQADYVGALSELIHSYESTHHPIDLSDVKGVDVLRHLMEERSMSASDLGRLLGNRALGSKLLRGERQLSKAAMVKLGEFFHVRPALFF